MNKKKIIIYSIIVIVAILLIITLIPKDKEITLPDRETKIPSTAIKISPEQDSLPPILHSNEYQKPVPLNSNINTAGAEDSPFIHEDKDELYFFFTPDPNIPAEKQLLDKVTGIYVSKKINNVWQKAERVLLQKSNKLALDGCEFVENNIMLFCSAREGYSGINWFSAEYKNNKWNFLKQVEFPKEYEVGELHKNNNELYYHSAKSGGKGQLDIWKIKRNSEGTWTSPENLQAINTQENEGWPYLTKDGNELWFTRTYLGSPAIYRSKKDNQENWQTPELIISQFAGEPTLDKEGNLYFVHHYYKDNKMLEADIYVAYKK
jgi:hypothetical protein